MKKRSRGILVYKNDTVGADRQNGLTHKNAAIIKLGGSSSFFWHKIRQALQNIYLQCPQKLAESAQSTTLHCAITEKKNEKKQKKTKNLRSKLTGSSEVTVDRGSCQYYQIQALTLCNLSIYPIHAQYAWIGQILILQNDSVVPLLHTFVSSYVKMTKLQPRCTDGNVQTCCLTVISGSHVRYRLAYMQYFRRSPD